MGKHLALGAAVLVCVALLASDGLAGDTEDALRAEIALLKQQVRAAQVRDKAARERYDTDIALRDAEIGELRTRMRTAQREINRLTRARDVALSQLGTAVEELAESKKRVAYLENSITLWKQLEVNRRERVGGILVALGERAVPLMVRALDAEGTYQGAFLVTFLGRMGPRAKAAIPALEKLVEKDIPESTAARWALKQIRGSK